MNSKKYLLLVILSSLTLVSCKSKIIEEEQITPPSELYNSALNLLEEGKYKESSMEFEKVFYQHPGNKITPNAELMQAYTLYKANEFDEAIDVLDIFIKLHPRNENIAYAYYLQALSNYAQISNVRLDQSKTRFAKEGLQEVIERFPGSKYAIDAALKIDLVNDHLAGKEMTVGRYYLKKKNPVAAIKRFQAVVEKYNTTSHIQEALYRMVESNLMFGLVDEAKKYSSVLKHNYSSSVWAQYSEDLLK
ncbi:MAG: outer membrane protein assembly factor BamD [Rickettsiaceae bacterium]|nr:outer membrane protein assembly factor BamD [Rickettsiaceae bacterium]